MGHENVWVLSLRDGKGELHKKCHPSILRGCLCDHQDVVGKQLQAVGTTNCD